MNFRISFPASIFLFKAISDPVVAALFFGKEVITDNTAFVGELATVSTGFVGVSADGITTDQCRLPFFIDPATVAETIRTNPYALGVIVGVHIHYHHGANVQARGCRLPEYPLSDTLWRAQTLTKWLHEHEHTPLTPAPQW